MFSGRRGIITARNGINGEGTRPMGLSRSPMEEGNGSEVDSAEENSPTDTNTWTSRVGFTLVKLGVNVGSRAPGKPFDGKNVYQTDTASQH